MACEGCEYYQRAIVFKKRRVGLLKKETYGDIERMCLLHNKPLTSTDTESECADYEEKEVD